MQIFIACWFICVSCLKFDAKELSNEFVAGAVRGVGDGLWCRKAESIGNSRGDASDGDR